MKDKLKNDWLDLGFEYTATKTCVNLTMKRYNYQEQYKFYRDHFVHTMSIIDLKTKTGKVEVLPIDYKMMTIIVKTMKDLSEEWEKDE